MGQSQCNRNTIGLNGPSKVLETEKLIIRDFNGKPHVELTAGRLIFTDDDGINLVSLNAVRSAAISSEIVSLTLYGTNGMIDLSAGSPNLKKDGSTPYLMVSDDKRNAQSFISPADINLWYANTQRAGLTAGKSGTSISFYDPADIPIPRVDLGIDTNGGNLRLADKNNKTRVVIGSTSLVDQRTGAKTITPEEALTLFDKNGTVSWQMPR